MKKFNFFRSGILLVVIVVFAYCSKDEGDVGPPGPAGTTGPQGPVGPAGPKGDTGTANVIYSQWVNTTWLPDTIMQGSVVIDTAGYFVNINAPKLTLNMLNTGEIKVYINLNTPAAPVVFPLPFNNGAVFIDATFFTNTIQLYSNADLTGLPARYILIPGSAPARMATINWNNYAEVKTNLGLED